MKKMANIYNVIFMNVYVKSKDNKSEKEAIGLLCFR